MLTPIDIQKRVFKTSFRGYDKREVDEFMTMISESLEKRIAELEDANARLSETEEEVRKFKNIENTLSETLLFAKQTSDELINAAREREEIMLKETELKMDEKVREKHAELLLLDQQIERLNRRHETSKMKMQNFLRMELQLLDSEIPTISSIKESGKKNKDNEYEDTGETVENDENINENPKPERAIVYTNLQQEEEDDDTDLPNLNNIRD